MNTEAEGGLKAVMKNKKQLKMILIGSFYGVFFIAQMLAWTIINYMRNYEKSMWFVTGIAALMTVITCTVYLLLRKLHQRFRGDEETSMVEKLYEILGTDR